MQSWEQFGLGIEENFIDIEIKLSKKLWNIWERKGEECKWGIKIRVLVPEGGTLVVES